MGESWGSPWLPSASCFVAADSSSGPHAPSVLGVWLEVIQRAKGHQVSNLTVVLCLLYVCLRLCLCLVFV